MTTLDQSKLARSRLLVADAFTRDRAAQPKPDPHDTATWLLEQLQNLGWKQPPDPAADIPPLAGPGADPDHRKACMDQIRQALPHRGENVHQ